MPVDLDCRYKRLDTVQSQQLWQHAWKEAERFNGTGARYACIAYAFLHILTGHGSIVWTSEPDKQFWMQDGGFITEIHASLVATPQ